MDLNIIESSHRKSDTLSIDRFLYTHNREQIIPAENRWLAMCFIGYVSVVLDYKLLLFIINNHHIIDPKGKKFIPDDHSHVPVPEIVKLKNIKQGIKRKANETKQ